jgi:hypothetical protein
MAVQDPLTFVWLIDDIDMKPPTNDIKPLANEQPAFERLPLNRLLYNLLPSNRLTSKPPAIEPPAIQPPAIQPIPTQSVHVIVRSRKMAFFVFNLLKVTFEQIISAR